MLRRTFLLGTAALTADCQRRQAASLGSLAWVDKTTLWIRELPDGEPRSLTTGHRIAAPRFSPLGGWITFRDGEAGWMVSSDGKARKPWNGNTWIPGRDELNERDVTFSLSGDKFAWTEGGRLFASERGAAPVDESAGNIYIAGFTAGGDWLVYWRAIERSASVEADGLDLYAVATGGGAPRKLGVMTLVHPDMISIPAVGSAIAVTAGAGRETWANKRIGVIDLAAASVAVNYRTEPSISAQFPAWSSDGKTLAWCAGPDADVENKSRLLASGQKTIRLIDGAGKRRDIPLTPSLRLSASEEIVDECVRLRRIVTARGPMTSNAGYTDERPVWSRDGSHILFCRKDGEDAKTIWIMRSDGGEQRQIAGPLLPPTDLTSLEKLGPHGFYGYTNWGKLFDWWRGA